MTLAVVWQVEEILDEYHSYLLMTMRQLFCWLVATYGFLKTERGYTRLCEYLVRARRAEMIDFDDIRDDGISRMHHGHYENEEHLLATVRTMGERFTLDKLANQEVNVRCYCEAEGMLPQVSRTRSHYSIPVYSCSGFDSLTAKHDLAR